ncbi:hypothetical protein HYC85_016308 [Camellia sinensis]|uniref:NADP-dependent oxidoreductase domain-containing protein n=1 Tax=Camellia sinensis TaxID=4442 RepID=A0A7J7GZH7_CAMSI|nr:hypothetical protein HYC85_016308 [Camellia sinensis]
MEETLVLHVKTVRGYEERCLHRENGGPDADGASGLRQWLKLQLWWKRGGRRREEQEQEREPERTGYTLMVGAKRNAFVSKLGYGCMGLTSMYNSLVPEEDGIAIIKYAFSKGITFIDTSDIYGADNANEILVGKALKQLPREKIQLATKFGIVKLDCTQVVVNGSVQYVRSCCEASLKCLGVDYIDLYYVHWIDTSVPIEETMGEVKELAEEGKIKYIGLSEASPNTIRRAHAVHPIIALQIEYSLLTRNIEEEIIPISRELGIAIVPYSLTAHGFFWWQGSCGDHPYK